MFFSFGKDFFFSCCCPLRPAGNQLKSFVNSEHRRFGLHFSSRRALACQTAFLQSLRLAVWRTRTKQVLPSFTLAQPFE